MLNVHKILLNIYLFWKQCGRKSQKYSHGCGECSRERDLVCYICRRKGHRQTFCPDRWRRYHSTVSVKHLP